MTSLFKNNKNWGKLLAIIESWQGTPYRHLIMVKGRGADCTLFIGACLKEYGIIKEVEYDYYPRDWYVTTKDDLVLNSFFDHWMNKRNERYDIIQLSKKAKKMRGDILAFTTNKDRITNHASIYMGRMNRGVMMCHSINGRGVSYFPYGKYWEGKLVGLYRIVEVT